MNKNGLNVYGDYIKKHSPSGFKSGLKYAAYFYIGATIAGLISPLFLVFGASSLANFLILPLAMLISNPIAWGVIGMIFIVASGVAMGIAKPLFHLAKDLINERRTSEKEKNEEERTELQDWQGKIPENQDRDSGIVTPENKDSFVDKTNKGDYECWLSTFDIEDVARVVYGYLPGGIKNDVLFSMPVSDSNIQCIKTLLEKYKQEVEKNHKLIFTSILYLPDKKHFATLVVAYSNQDQKFRAYYSDSYFNSPLPGKVSDTIQEILNVEKGDIRSYYTKQQSDTHNCGILALENAKIIKDILEKGEPFDSIDKKLSEYKPSSEQLKEKRKEFAKALEKDGQSRASTPNSKNSDVSSDSGISLDDKEFCEDWPTLVHKTNIGRYGYWLQQHDIAHIARVVYKYSESPEENSESNAFFCIPGDVNTLNERLKEYKNKVEKIKQEDLKEIFTSVINLGGNHWVTLVITYEPINKKFMAYYCDSLGNLLPSASNKLNDIKLANKITEQQIEPLMNRVNNLILEGEVNPDSAEVEEQKKNIKEALRCVREDRSKLVNKQIDVYYIAGVLQETLGINDNSNIRSSKTPQQSDSCNCGIFALENSHRITQMLNEGKSFDEVKKKLSEHIPNKEELIKKRQEFTRALMNDEEWRIADENGLLYERAEIVELTPPFSRFESVTSLASSFCPIM